MKNLFRVFICLVIGMSFIACGPSITATPAPSSIPPTATVTEIPPTATSSPSPTLIPTMEVTPEQAFVRPTLIPTIDPTLIPNLLRDAFSIQTTEGVNGHKMRQITGWDYGFGGGVWTGSCASFDWLDASHLLLHPATGEVNGPEGYWGKVNVAHHPVVINLERGSVWLPPVNELASPLGCKSVHWSRDLGIFLIPEIHDGVSTVSTYTYDGHKLSNYPGSLLSVSPSGTKILVAEDTLIDLRTHKEIKLNWSLEDYREEMLSGLFWTSDETRVYRCCYFYADLNNGTSYHYTKSDFLDSQGNSLDYAGLWMYRGEWIRDDTFFLVWWSYVDDGDIRYLPMFNPAEKILYDVRERAGISADLTCPETTVSTKGSYVWIECYETHYLINLTSFETSSYPSYSNFDVGWSADENFAWLQSYENEKKQYYLLSVLHKKLETLLVNPAPISWQDLWWHPIDAVFAYLSDEGQKLQLVIAQTMSNRELSLPTAFQNFVWSPKGDRIALVANDNSLWQVDYPNLENLEQLTPSLPDRIGVSWSPDGRFITFISSSDIYIVEANK